MNQVTVVTSALREEAARWSDLSDGAAGVGQAVRRLALAPEAFSIGEQNMAAHSQAYEAFQGFMSTVLDGAVAEFDQLGAALRKIADAYEEADAVIALDLDKIYRV